MEFAEQVKSSVDIVSVVQEYGPRLRKSGNNYSGLCPFHNEKTPSFSVSATKQFYYCFGCHAKGDVISFVMEIEKVSFYEALKTLAERHGIPIPKRSQYADEDSKLRGAIFQMQEYAQDNFRANLNGPLGEAARSYLAKRGVAPATIEQFGLGYSDRSGRALLRILDQRNFPQAQWEQSGLLRKRDDGTFYDYFRNRLMFPIHNESGKIIGFGGRALAPDDNPKYLNSPETPIYRKSAVVYNLHRAKEAIHKEDRVILVEGYMDAIGVTAAGFRAVVASCGTALTAHQVQVLKRHSQKISVNFDPDAPGANAAERSIGLLLEEGMQIRIVELDGELDPDEYCKERGAGAYQQRLDAAKGYFFWLADRARKNNDMRTPEGKVGALKALLPAVGRISDRLERMAIANEVAGYIAVERGLVLDSFLKAAADRQEKSFAAPRVVLRPDERILLNGLLALPEIRGEVIAALKSTEAAGTFPSRRVFQAIFALDEAGGPFSFEGVIARLEESDRNLLAQVAFTAAAAISREEVMAALRRVSLTDDQNRVAQTRARIRELERAGNLEEALRLMAELPRLSPPARNTGSGDR